MSSQGQMKSFYRQRKKADTAASAKAKPSSKRSQSPAATLGSDVVQSPSLPFAASPNLHALDGGFDEKEEEVLRQFDMNMAFGPCLGMSRLDRWERASRLGLNPPKEIRSLLDCNSAGARSRSLWDGLI